MPKVYNGIEIIKLCESLGCLEKTSYTRNNKLYCAPCPLHSYKICCFFCTTKYDCKPKEHFNTIDEAISFALFKKLDRSE